MHVWLVSILLFMSFNTFAAPQEFLKLLNKQVQKIELEQNMDKRISIFNQFYLSSKEMIDKKDSKVRMKWRIARESVSPIAELLNRSEEASKKDCEELQKRLRYEGLMGRPEGSQLSEITNLSLRLAAALCRGA